MSIEEAAQDKAALRPWLYEALPEMDETDGTPYATKDGVRESIEQATDGSVLRRSHLMNS